MTLGSRLMDKKPLQMVAMTKVTKLNQMVGMLKMLRIDIFLTEDTRPPFDSLLWEAEDDS